MSNLGIDGDAFPVATSVAAPAKAAVLGTAAEINAQMKGLGLLAQLNTYLQSLQNISQPSEVRARDPFSNHPWVFAAAMTIAVVAGQAPLKVMRETGRGLEERRRKAREWGYDGHPRAGKARRAVERYLSGPPLSRLFWKGVEEDYQHPLTEVFRKPNDYQDGGQLAQFCRIHFALRGEYFWILTGPECSPLAPGEKPTQIWPFGPDYFEPVLEHGTHGRLIGWWFRPPVWYPAAGGVGTRVPLRLHEVVQFKYPNPLNPLRGMSRITAAALGIEMALLVKTQHRSLLKNQAVPKGVMTFNGPIDVKEMEAKAQEFKEKNENVDNAGRTLWLAGGWGYQPIGLSPQDMQNLELLELDKQETLAVMGVPPSVLGVTDFKTYATQLGQDKNLWDKNLIPMLNLEERTIDASPLFADETDDVFPAHDLKGVEALRAGQADKINMMNTLTGPSIHMPPKDAALLVDLKHEPYEGDDKALVPPLLATVEDVVAGMAAQVDPGAQPVDPSSEEDQPAGGTPPASSQTPADGNPPGKPKPKGLEAVVERVVSRAVSRVLANIPGANDEKSAKADSHAAPGVIVRTSREEWREKALKWKDFLKVESRLERPMGAAYRSWVVKLRQETLARFDTEMGLRDANIDLTKILFDLEEAKNKLKHSARPVYTDALHAVYDLTSQEIGVPVFEIDDDRIMRVFTEREQRFIGSAPATLLANLKNTLVEGVKAGETIQQLRTRIGQVYNIATGAAKTLQVARTEMGGFMNNVRDKMFEAQGFDTEEWLSAGDEHTRETHVLYGQAGPKPRGFNYMELSGETNGTLSYPGDLNAPPHEVINCRCVKVPASDAKAGRQAQSAIKAALEASEKPEAPATPPQLHLHLNQTIEQPPAVVHEAPLPAPSPAPVPKRIEREVKRDGEGRIVKIIDLPTYGPVSEEPKK